MDYLLYGEQKTSDQKQVSLKYLFLTFLKIGAISFGGFMALVSVVRDQMVEKDKIVEDKTILDGVSLASVLPGPLAVNVVTYVGYQLRGLAGALVTMTAVMAPSFVLMILLSAVYFRFGNVTEMNHFFSGVMPAVVAIIFAVALNMAKKSITDVKQGLICVIAGIALVLFKGFYTTIIIILAGALAGLAMYNKPAVGKTHGNKGRPKMKTKTIWKPIAAMAVIFFVFYSFFDSRAYLDLLLQITATFTGMGLTLFGGGYVFIPAIQEVVVDQLNWLSATEFADGIAMGQITPGPILISATFIGYKVAGIVGAIVATISIFLPPGLLMVLLGRSLHYFSNSPYIDAVFKGLRPAVIGMIFSAAVSMGSDINPSWQSISLLSLALVAVLGFKAKVVYVIPLAGILGLILFRL